MALALRGESTHANPVTFSQAFGSGFESRDAAFGLGRGE